MKKGNKVRFFLWGLVWVLLLSSSIYGFLLYFEGYGESGKKRKQLYPIIQAFNSLEGLNAYKNVGININSKYKDGKIIITYGTTKSTIDYEFEYKELSGEKILESKFSQADENNANIIIKSIIDAVSITLGHDEGDTFERYQIDDFYRTNISDGVRLIIDNTSIVAYINIEKAAIDYINPEDLTRAYLTYKDLESLNFKLNSENEFVYNKNNTTLYVINTDDYYDIYIQNGSYDDDLYKSILSVINILDINNIIKDEFEISYPVITSSKTFGNYIITIDADVSSMDKFKSNEKVVRIQIKK